MKLIQTIVFLFLGICYTYAQSGCEFSTIHLIDIHQDGTWDEIVLDTPVNVKYNMSSFQINSMYINKPCEVIDEFPVQKIVYVNDWVAMYSNIEYCSWVGIARGDMVTLYLNRAVNVPDIVSKF